MSTIDCFKAYDVRGRVPAELNEDIAYRIGRAYAAFVEPRTVAVGRDIRASSDALADALIAGLTDAGVDVVDIGLGGTEFAYFATFNESLDGGIMVTASHNPPDYNGMKFVREGSRPISADSGLVEIRALAERNEFPAPTTRGSVSDRLEAHLPFEFIKIHHEPDSSFPNGVPNPMLEENRAVTSRAVIESGADLGLAWDGDFDRCFFFDGAGRFIEGYYIVGLLAAAFLAKSPGERIVHDPRLTWNTREVIAAGGGEAVLSKSGHAFIKQVMRDHDAVYGGEMSAHHYFRDFSYADSGMIPWLLVTEIMCTSGQSLAALVDERVALFPASGEINRKVDDAQAVIKSIEQAYTPGAVDVDHVDGLSVAFRDWRFNIRSSNTEPLLRLNVESRGDIGLMQEKTAELLARMGGTPG